MILRTLSITWGVPGSLPSLRKGDPWTAGTEVPAYSRMFHDVVTNVGLQIKRPPQSNYLCITVPRKG